MNRAPGTKRAGPWKLYFNPESKSPSTFQSHSQTLRNILRLPFSFGQNKNTSQQVLHMEPTLLPAPGMHQCTSDKLWDTTSATVFLE